MTLRFRDVCLAAVIVGCLLNTNAHAGRWEIKTIAHTSAEFGWPRISDGRVAWIDGDEVDSDIFVYENGSITQVTHNQGFERLIDIAGNRIAWFEYDPKQGHNGPMALVLDGKVIVDRVQSAVDARLEPEGLAWSDRSGTAIQFYDGSATRTLAADGTTSNHNPDISGSRIVWSAFETDHNRPNDGNRAYIYDGLSVAQLPNGVGIGQTPRINGNYIAGVLVNESNQITGVTRYNIATGELESFPSERRATTTPYISGEQMAWIADVDGVSQIFALDSHGVPVQLSGGKGDKTGPTVADSFVAWTDNDFLGAVFVFDGNSTIKIADTGGPIEFMDADADALVWRRPVGDKYEIVVARFVVPEPSGLTIAAIAVVLCIAHASRFSADREARNGQEFAASQLA